MANAQNAPKPVRDLLFHLGSRPDVEAIEDGDFWIVSIPLAWHDALEAVYSASENDFGIWRMKWDVTGGLSHEEEISENLIFDAEECALNMKAELARIEEEFQRIEDSFPKEDD